MGAKRKPLSKKIRFEVFKRDDFTCQYCGAVPPSVVLEVDHISPVASGGKDDIENLLTACFECNRGKAHRLLSETSTPLNRISEEAIEREAQLKEYQKLLNRVRRRENKYINEIQDIFKETYPDYFFMKQFKENIRINFVRNLDRHSLLDAMQIAVERIDYDHERCIKYFCGVCWNKIKGFRR